MKKKSEKSRREKAVLLGMVTVFTVMLCGWQIWNVNHTDLIEKYRAKRIICEEGSDISLSDAIYYWDVAELEGYHMRVIGTTVMQTDAFLAQYDMTIEELEELSSDGTISFDNYGLIYLVTVEFWNENWMEPSGNSVLLDNFLLTGVDYFVLPATGSIHLISGFNLELGGASGFSIKSDRRFEVVLPYLIDTESETRISLEKLLDLETKLLITVYPEERYLMLPRAVVEA